MLWDESSSTNEQENSQNEKIDKDDDGAGDNEKPTTCRSFITEFLFFSPEYSARYTFGGYAVSILISLTVKRLIFGGALGHNIYKKIGNGNFHIYTSNLPSIPKFMHIGISYKINERVYFNLIEFNFISFIGCGIIGQAVSSSNLTIFRFRGVTIWEKIFAFVFLLKRGCHFAVLSICFYKYFCLNIDILGSIIDYGINKLGMKILGIEPIKSEEENGNDGETK